MSAETKSTSGTIYIGTYTKENGQGIYTCRFDRTAGRLGKLRLAAQLVNPSFLAVSPSGERLYAVSETVDGEVSAFAIDSQSGDFSFLNEVSSGGAGPCRLVLDASGKNVLVANYGSGSIAVLPVGKNGMVEEAASLVQHVGSSRHAVRQKSPHPHSATLSPDNRYVLVADLGLDKIFVYHFNPARGLLTPSRPPFVPVEAGAGPRHCVFHPRGRWVYVINELQSSVAVFAFDPLQGTLKALQTVSTLPRSFRGDNLAAEIQAHPNGQFLYASNRGHGSIAIFAVDLPVGRLIPCRRVATQGKTPRHFSIDPSGKFLLVANQDSDTVEIFHIHAKTGDLKKTGRQCDAPSPACIKFAPTQAVRRTGDDNPAKRHNSLGVKEYLTC